MKKLFVALMTLTLAFALLPAAALSDEGEHVIWQVGTSDGDVDPIEGASEYPATEKFYETFDYYVGTDDDPITEPTMPGYIGTANVCEFVGDDDDRPCTDTTQKLNINFTLDQGYDATLHYDRYGSESDELYLDGQLLGTAGGTEENRFQELTYELDSLPFGDHTITIEYAGGAEGNGHYIDYLKLTADACFSAEWLPPITLDDWTLNENATLPIKFQLLGCDGEVITELDPTLTVYFGEDLEEGEIQELRFDEDEFHYIANFRPTQSGPHMAVVELDDLAVGERAFEVVEPGQANGQGKGN